MLIKHSENPLALAVLALLCERPMHPYEMATTLRARKKDRNIRLRFGTLYTVIDALRREQHIAPCESQQDGRRSERTVFGITVQGKEVLSEWVSDSLSTPVHEYPQFLAALSLMPIVSPQHAAQLLGERLANLDMATRKFPEEVSGGDGPGPLPALSVDEEYRLAIARAERRFVARLVEQIGKGELRDMAAWRELHHGGGGGSRPVPDHAEGGGTPSSTKQAADSS